MEGEHAEAPVLRAALHCPSLRMPHARACTYTHSFSHTCHTQVLTGLGMVPSAPALVPPGPPAHLTVMLDGKVVGSIAAALAPSMVARCARGVCGRVRAGA